MPSQESYATYEDRLGIIDFRPQRLSPASYRPAGSYGSKFLAAAPYTSPYLMDTRLKVLCALISVMI